MRRKLPRRAMKPSNLLANLRTQKAKGRKGQRTSMRRILVQSSLRLLGRIFRECAGVTWTTPESPISRPFSKNPRKRMITRPERKAYPVSAPINVPGSAIHIRQIKRSRSPKRRLQITIPHGNERSDRLQRRARVKKKPGLIRSTGVTC